jgi:rubredoxin
MEIMMNWISCRECDFVFEISNGAVRSLGFVLCPDCGGRN